MSVDGSIKEILTDLGIEAGDIVPGARLEDDLDMDSTEVVELNAALNDRFGCRLPAGWYKGRTVQDLVAFVEQGQSRGDDGEQRWGAAAE